jgi:hypothetical protein
MTLEQLAYKVTHLEREVARLKKANALSGAEYLTAAQVKARFGYSEATLRRYRKAGLVTDYQMSVKGRGFKYSSHQLEKLFTAKVKIA